jgi:hypothetical protein
LFESGRLRTAPPPVRIQGSNAANTLTPFCAIEPGPSAIVDCCEVHVVGVVFTCLILLLISFTIVMSMKISVPLPLVALPLPLPLVALSSDAGGGGSTGRHAPDSSSSTFPNPGDRVYLGNIVHLHSLKIHQDILHLWAHI